MRLDLSVFSTKESSLSALLVYIMNVSARQGFDDI